MGLRGTLILNGKRIRSFAQHICCRPLVIALLNVRLTLFRWFSAVATGYFLVLLGPLERTGGLGLTYLFVS